MRRLYTELVKRCFPLGGLDTAASRSTPCISSSSLSPPTLVYPLSPPSFVPMSCSESFVMDTGDSDASDDSGSDSELEIAATFFTAGVEDAAEVLPVVAGGNAADELRTREGLAGIFNFRVLLADALARIRP